MSRELRGTRYLTKKNEALARFITDSLRYLDFEETQDFYEKAVVNLDHMGRALLGCNDRYFLLTGLLQRVDALHPWLFSRCREVEANPHGHIDLWARFHYKDVCSENIILTSAGWKKHGDLRPGDFVYSPSGKPVRVIATKHFTDSACRRVRFDNGAEVICGAGHLWRVEVSYRGRVSGTNKRVGRKVIVAETDELARMRSQYRPVIRTTAALDMPEDNELPIDPYVFGAWLGDGHSDGGTICGQDEEVFEQIASRGYTLSHNHCPKRAPFRVSTVYGLRTELGDLNVLGAKSIPAEYLMASARQRLELLRGLIDTDGHVSATNQCVTFAQKNKAIAEGVQFLANSLGFKARLTPVRSTDSWHVTFQVGDGDPDPCYIKRKIGALRKLHHRKIRGWKIASIEPVETVPTNCIQVDSDDGMYLCGRDLIPTHNSTIITFAGVIQEILIDPEITIAIFSVVKPTAQEFLNRIKEEFENNDYLKALYSDVLYTNPKGKSPGEGRPAKWGIARGITVKRRSNTVEATIEAHGLIDGQPTGRHFKMHVYDDVVTQDHLSESEIKKTTERWEMADNLGTHLGTIKWIAGTRYHFADTYQEILERKSAKPRIYPATDDGTATGKPVFLTVERLREIRRDQRTTFNAQMLLDPIAGTDASFSTQWLRTYDVIPSVMNVYIMIDPSKGRSRTSDRTAIAVIGVDVNGNKYLLDGFCHRMKLSERWAFIKQLETKWRNHRGVVYVKVGYEQYGMQSDLEVIEEYQQRDNTSILIEEINTPREGGHSKKDRIERLEPDLRESRFFLPAVVHDADHGGRDRYLRMAYWTVWTDIDQETWVKDQKAKGVPDPICQFNLGQVIYRPVVDLTRAQKICEQSGQLARIVTAIRRRDENGDLYDVTRVFINEMARHPFAAHDDFIDAASRIYDLNPIKPEAIEVGAGPMLEDRHGYGQGYDS